MEDRFERFSQAISQINRHWRKLAAEEMEPYGLKGPHCAYLLALFRHPAGLTAPQLVEICRKDKADVSRMMKILEQKGMVRKDGSHQNRYGGVFVLTGQGQAAADRVRQRAALAVDYAGGDLTAQQRAAFYETLETIVDRLTELSRDGIPSTLGDI